MTPTTIEWPKVTIGGVKERFTLRYAYASDYQLARWGRNLASANSLELAASMAGTFDTDGNWRSAGFDRPVDLADLMLPEEEKPLIEAVGLAVKNRYPELEVKAQPVPGIETAPNPAKTGSSGSGPLPLQSADSDSATDVSGV
jgi:hypothetical protein